ncbi:MAG: TlyA family RNA methyltransferase [Syntrophothermus sp.]|uniref:TlyA family RNA methyltransferase n=1 Tax=Syntrophothermus sp. TaxID=2736299 RepID=UPI00257F57BA|nr:TlyA family RNA methyltransferase [Syntrophothermus sp.]NSW84317.1 TlyA family RNA methyltransferase [Syntrophothermus sp.]
MVKSRLDTLVHDRGLAPTREKARALILAGKVVVNGNRVDKPGTKVPVDANIVVLEGGLTYVSRGGLKLEGAIRDFGLSFTGKRVLDVGASTGGFTDCALQHGALSVVALDVGYGQLDWRLRNHERVLVKEKTNIRNFSLEDLGEPVDIVTIDVSFISLGKVLPAVSSLVREGGEIVALVKPQFEAGRDQVGKKGVVRSRETHNHVILKVIESAVGLGLSVRGVTYSPLTGPKGNIEYFLYLVKDGQGQAVSARDIERVVENAHRQLGDTG